MNLLFMLKNTHDCYAIIPTPTDMEIYSGKDRKDWLDDDEQPDMQKVYIEDDSDEVSQIVVFPSYSDANEEIKTILDAARAMAPFCTGCDTDLARRNKLLLKDFLTYNIEERIGEFFLTGLSLDCDATNILVEYLISRVDAENW